MKKLFLLLFLILIANFSKAQTETKTGMNSLTTNPAISVTIGGKFIVNGSFPAMYSERVDQFVTRIYNAAKENSLSIAKDLSTAEKITKNINEDYAIRGIILKSANGEERKIDLAKFRVNGDFKNNPYLKNDDVLIFPSVDLERNFIRILGAVNNPTIFMYVDGDKLSDAIELAQGINKAYEDVKYANIYRLNYEGSKIDTLVVPITQDIALQRGDRIVIQANETKRKDYKVNVIGEVNRPGYVPITFNNTTIADVIKAVGGFKDDADIPKAEIIRGANAFESIIFSEQLEKLMMSRMSTLVEADSLYFEIDEKLRFMRGNGLVNFTKIFDESSPDSKFLVQDYDVIYVPRKIDLVYIYGQVNKTGYVKYSPDKTYQYYLNLGGGIGETAADIYIIRGQSRSWISVSDKPGTIIQPGDYIWVSKKTPRSFWFYVEQIGRVTGILGSVATVLLLFIQASK